MTGRQESKWSDRDKQIKMSKYFQTRLGCISKSDFRNNQDVISSRSPPTPPTDATHRCHPPTPPSSHHPPPASTVSTTTVQQSFTTSLRKSWQKPCHTAVKPPHTTRFFLYKQQVYKHTQPQILEILSTLLSTPSLRLSNPRLG